MSGRRANSMPQGISTTRSQFYIHLNNLVENIMANPTMEAPYYSFHGQYLTMLCATARFYEEDPEVEASASLACHPQAVFVRGFDPTISAPGPRGRRSPDFAITSTFENEGDDDVPMTSLLGFWMEVKPQSASKPWNSIESRTLAVRTFPKAFQQLCEQALFAFGHYPGEFFKSFLTIGWWYCLVRFRRPPDGAASAGGQPSTPKQWTGDSVHWKPSPTGVHPVPLPIPEILHFLEPIMILEHDQRVLNPVFLQALNDAQEGAIPGLTFAPSFLQVRPGVFGPTPQYVKEGQVFLRKWKPNAPKYLKEDECLIGDLPPTPENLSPFKARFYELVKRTPHLTRKRAKQLQREALALAAGEPENQPNTPVPIASGSGQFDSSSEEDESGDELPVYHPHTPGAAPAPSTPSRRSTTRNLKSKGKA
ncbi:hypothetical protein BV25DRAFT_1840935 [Artomyces pyxidatus]|uniref:Uncharacterized protein n=1 Tax=Artomyces pyxidatus TaxID=48021 RepID=A0ACB8SQU2_9AGAM|nr:hypothetical protein BV25DRAFT_1840935 [Artomyces pyxidatus]